ncbi:MAG: hypothetical protein RRA35_08440, partial [Desulfomonilia bacterium]|nr:hypothetical protein [Desulfomonilia bacterium]
MGPTFMNPGSESRDCHHLCDVTLFALRSLERALRYFHPLLVSEIQDRLIPVRQKLAEAYADSERLNAVSLEEGSRLRLKKSAGLLLRALDLFSEQDDLQRIVFNAMRAGRIYAQVQEILFSLKKELVPVHLFFLEEELQDRRGVPIQGQASPGDDLLHEGFDADPYARGGCSYYLPPGSVQDQPLPLVVALHGGGGHGRDFIWFWLKEARSRRLLLMAPTSVGETWTISRTQKEFDSITEHIERFSARAKIDRERMLLTGISDGATFCLACSLLE